MVLVEELILNQTKLYDRKKGYYSYFINKYKTNFTVGDLECRISQLQTNWNKYQKNHSEICINKTEAHDEQEYFKNSVFFLDEVEEIVCEQVGKFTEYKRKLILSKQSSSSQIPVVFSSNNNSNSEVRRKLPAVPIPKFNGDFKEWIPYKNLFTQLVVNSHLSDAEKLSLLKDSLSNEPLFLIKDLTVTEGHFVDQIWGKLLNRYDNSRNIIYSHVNTLLAVKPMSEESLQQLRKLVNQVDSSVDSSKALKSPIEHWNHFLVPLVINCLDQVTRKEWETSIGAKVEPSTYDELIDFLNQKTRTLEALERSSKSISSKSKYQQSNSSNTKSNNNKQSQSSIPKSLNVTKPSNSSECYFCSGDHTIYTCGNFRKKPVNERSEFVKASNLCFNCLAKHNIKERKSKKTCSICHQRHHSLLHDSSRFNQSHSSSSATRASFFSNRFRFLFISIRFNTYCQYFFLWHSSSGYCYSSGRILKRSTFLCQSSYLPWLSSFNSSRVFDSTSQVAA